MNYGLFRKKTTKIGFNNSLKFSSSPSINEDEKKKEKRNMVERISDNQLNDLYEKTEKRIKNNRTDVKNIISLDK